MAEFGIATGALQVASAGFGLARTLYLYIESVRKAEKQLKPIAENIRLTADVLQHVGNLMKTKDVVDLCKPDVISSTQDALNGCKKAFEELEAFLQTFVKLDKAGNIVASTTGKLTWSFKQNELDARQNSLEHFKRSLDTIIGLLNLASSISTEKKLKDHDRIFDMMLEVGLLREAERAARAKDEQYQDTMDESPDVAKSQATAGSISETSSNTTSATVTHSSTRDISMREVAENTSTRFLARSLPSDNIPRTIVSQLKDRDTLAQDTDANNVALFTTVLPNGHSMNDRRIFPAPNFEASNNSSKPSEYCSFEDRLAMHLDNCAEAVSTLASAIEHASQAWKSQREYSRRCFQMQYKNVQKTMSALEEWEWESIGGSLSNTLRRPNPIENYGLAYPQQQQQYSKPAKAGAEFPGRSELARSMISRIRLDRQDYRGTEDNSGELILETDTTISEEPSNRPGAMALALSGQLRAGSNSLRSANSRSSSRGASPTPERVKEEKKLRAIGETVTEVDSGDRALIQTPNLHPPNHSAEVAQLDMENDDKLDRPLPQAITMSRGGSVRQDRFLKSAESEENGPIAGPLGKQGIQSYLSDKRPDDASMNDQVTQLAKECRIVDEDVALELLKLKQSTKVDNVTHVRARVSRAYLRPPSVRKEGSKEDSGESTYEEDAVKGHMKLKADLTPKEAEMRDVPADDSTKPDTEGLRTISNNQLSHVTTPANGPDGNWAIHLSPPGPYPTTTRDITASSKDALDSGLTNVNYHGTFGDLSAAGDAAAFNPSNDFDFSELIQASDGFTAINDGQDHSLPVSPRDDFNTGACSPSMSVNVTNLTTPDATIPVSDESYDTSPLFTDVALCPDDDSSSAALLPIIERTGSEIQVLVHPGGKANRKRSSTQPASRASFDPVERHSGVAGNVAARKRDKPLPPIVVDGDDAVALKRARNTAAARKSRAKKVDERESLESKIAELERETVYWKTRAQAFGQVIGKEHLSADDEINLEELAAEEPDSEPDDNRVRSRKRARTSSEGSSRKRHKTIDGGQVEEVSTAENRFRASSGDWGPRFAFERRDGESGASSEGKAERCRRRPQVKAQKEIGMRKQEALVAEVGALLCQWTTVDLSTIGFASYLE